MVIGLYSGELSAFTEDTEEDYDGNSSSTVKHQSGGRSGGRRSSSNADCSLLGTKCVDGGVWRGYDIALMDKLALIGKFRCDYMYGDWKGGPTR